MRLFETLAQGGAFWVLVACGLFLGVLDTLLRVARVCAGDRLWARILTAPFFAAVFLGLTVAAVQYSYPYGFRLWQAGVETAAWALFMIGPGGFLLDLLRVQKTHWSLRRQRGKGDADTAAG